MADSSDTRTQPPSVDANAVTKLRALADDIEAGRAKATFVTQRARVVNIPVDGGWEKAETGEQVLTVDYKKVWANGNS